MKKKTASMLAEIEHGVRQFYSKYPFKIEGMSPMHFAAMYGNICDLKSLINDSAISDYPRNDRKRTPLHYAALNGQLEAFKILLQKYGNVNPKDEEDHTPLFMAARNGHFEVCQFIIEQCEKNNSSNGKRGLTPLHKAVKNGLTPLRLAACYGHLRVCKLLYENMSSNLDDEEWVALLRIAACGQKGSDGGDYDVCNFFVNEVRNKYFDDVDSILRSAAQMGNLEICKLYVENLNIIPKNKYFQYSKPTSLHAAARKGHFEVFKVIMKSFKNINPTDENGHTPLHRAAEIGHFHLCELILSNVKNKNPRNNYDLLPIDFAEENNHKAVIQLLKEAIRNPSALKRPRQFDAEDTDNKLKKIKLNGRESLKATQKKLGMNVVRKKMMPLEIESFIIEIILLETSKHAGNLNEISTAISEKLKKQYGGKWSVVIVKSGHLPDSGCSITTTPGCQINLTYDGHNYTVFKVLQKTATCCGKNST